MRVLLLLLLLAGVAQAETVTVKSGEHDDFTRLVLQLAAPVSWQMGRSADGYALRFDRDDLRFDLTDAFTLIPRDRLAAIWADPATGVLRLGIGCACHAVAFEFRPDILVIDIRNGPPPPGSSFEQPLAGNAVPPLTARADPRPRMRPQTFAMTSGPLSGLPDPALASFRDTLLRQLGRGAAQGVIDFAAPPPRPAGPQRAAVAGGPQDHLAIGPGFTIGTLGPAESDVTPAGAACLPDAAIDVASWADDRPFATQIADRRAAILGEFDRADPAAIAALARLQLAFGFGAETQALILALDVTDPDVGLWQVMAQIMDGGFATNTSLLQGMEVCDSMVALWAMLAKPALRVSDRVNTRAVLRTFSALPPHLRRLLGPPLAARFLDVGDVTTAGGLRDATLRAPGGPAPGSRVMAAKVALAAGEAAAAVTELSRVAEDGGPATAEALIALVEAALAGGSSAGARVGAEEATALAAFAHEHRGAPLGPALRRAEVLALALAGAHGAAFALAEAGESRTQTDLWTLLARDGPDSAVLEQAILPGDAVLPALDTATRLYLARRLLDLGFPEAATRWIGADSDPETRLLAAEAALQQGDARAALRATAGLAGLPAALLRADAATRLGEPAVAADALAAAGETAAGLRARWQAQDWPVIAEAGPEPQRAAVTALLPDLTTPSGPLPAPVDGPLAQGRALIAQSTAARAVILSLLEAVPAPATAP